MSEHDKAEAVICQRCGLIFAACWISTISPEWKNKAKQYKENGCEVKTISGMQLSDWCECDKPKTKGDKID